MAEGSFSTFYASGAPVVKDVAASIDQLTKSLPGGFPGAKESASALKSVSTALKGEASGMAGVSRPAANHLTVAVVLTININFSMYFPHTEMKKGTNLPTS